MTTARGCVEVFYQSFEKTDSGCWLWSGPKDHCGYGIINYHPGIGRPARYRAHRLSLQLASGEMGDGLYACHHCDTPACVRPSHLFWGTQADNMRDASLKGRPLGTFNAAKTHCPYGHPLSIKRKSDGSRYCPICYRARHRRWRALQPKAPKPIGANHGMAKLTDAAVIEIRRSSAPSRVLAAQYDVSLATIKQVRSRRIWRHLP